MTAKTYMTAYVVDGWMHLVEGDETLFEAHDRLMGLWKEIARPDSQNRLISLEPNTLEALNRAWPGVTRMTDIDMTSDHDLIMNLEEYAPEADHVMIYNLRTDTNRDEIASRAEEVKWTNGEDTQRPLSPTLELLIWKRGEEEPEFVGTFGLNELSLTVCANNDDIHTSRLIMVRLGPWSHVPVHGDHLAQLAEIATKMDARCAQYLRDEAEEWQREIDVAEHSASAPRT
jgi:hypothetical protein